MKTRRAVSHITLLCVSIYLLSVFFNQPALAAKKGEEAQRHVAVPVLYLTDRSWTGETFGPERKYPIECLHHMNYGSATVNVPATATAIDQDHARLGWSIGDEKFPKICRKDRIETGSHEKDKTEFFSRVEKALADSQSDRLCVFVHGAADPFEDALLDAAELAYNMECPTIIYSWPSVGPIKMYHIDEGNCEWSQAHYNMFCKDLAAFIGQHPGLKVSLIAHSMGNRLVARSTLALHDIKGGAAHDIALVSPDVDAGTFMHYVIHYHNRGAKVRLYVSRRDKVLSYTQMLYGGYYRIGEDVGPVLGMLSGDQLGQEAAAHDQEPKQKSKFEKIDYSELDTKMIGHHFPFKLVASMSRDNGPGEGLKLVPETVTEGNRTSRFAEWRYRSINGLENTFKSITKAGKHDTARGDSPSTATATTNDGKQKESADEGSSCQRVVIDEPKKHTVIRGN